MRESWRACDRSAPVIFGTKKPLAIWTAAVHRVISVSVKSHNSLLATHALRLHVGVVGHISN